MALNSWGFIYPGFGAEDPAADRGVIKRGGLKTTIVAVPERKAAVRAATALVDDGAQLIELCGAFGPVWTARFIEAVGDRVPVGAATYGRGIRPRPGSAAGPRGGLNRGRVPSAAHRRPHMDRRIPGGGPLAAAGPPWVRPGAEVQ
ncbi:DUF6506 family protein [Streptomyces sp. NPDC018964]|uniref:DUF6506 family protein n=1 Tax=Streptomyces sp. NPDC018964 TaxID=3365058 RepID=UPI0037AAB977